MDPPSTLEDFITCIDKEFLDWMKENEKENIEVTADQHSSNNTACVSSCHLVHGNQCKCQVACLNNENIPDLQTDLHEKPELVSQPCKTASGEIGLAEPLLVPETAKTSLMENYSVNKQLPSMNSKDSNDATKSVENLTVYLPDGYKISQISSAWEDFTLKDGDENIFLKGCKWAPDGTCLLTNSEDKYLRVFDLPPRLYSEKTWRSEDTLPELRRTLQVKEGGLIYDYCWYTLMKPWDTASSCFFSSAKGEPVHLWDAFTGKLRATYRACNYADEVISPYCLTVTPDGGNLYCGFKNKVYIYDIPNPRKRPTVFDVKELADQAGIVSTIAINPTLQSVFAVGTYQKTVGLYSATENCSICVFSGHSGGLTHIMFSPDGSQLYAGSRNDSEIVGWDLRNPGNVLFSLYRNVTTNQRMYFDLTPDGKKLISGNTDGNVSIWNLGSEKIGASKGPIKPDFMFQAHNDCSNGISVNQHCSVLATSSGQRHFPEIIDADDDSDTSDDFDEVNYKLYKLFQKSNKKKENSVKLWWIGPSC